MLLLRNLYKRNLTLNLVFLFILVFNLSCASTITSCLRDQKPNSPGHVLPYRAFVGIVSTNIVITDRCEPGEQPPCTDKRTILGSGSIIYRSQKKENIAYVLTAKHICDHKDEINEKEIKVKHNFYIKDFENRKHNAVHYFSVSSLMVDACVLLINDMDDKLVATEVSENPPKLGDSVINIAAPGGFYGNGINVTVDGRYSGDDGAISVYTVPSAGGSSGSPIFNINGQLVGMVWGYPLRRDGVRIFEQLTFSIKHDDIIKIMNVIKSADNVIDQLEEKLNLK